MTDSPRDNARLAAALAHQVKQQVAERDGRGETDAQLLALANAVDQLAQAFRWWPRWRKRGEPLSYFD
jgi:hypothetical protein